jgi:PAS domain S-box-containing protein
MNIVVPDLPVPLAVFMAAVDQHSIVSIADANGAILYANSRFCEISGYTLPELIGRNHRLLKSGVHPDDFYLAMWAAISNGKVWHGDVCNRARDGSLYWVKSTINPVLDVNGLPTHYISVRTDITAQKSLAVQLNSLTNELTELFRIAPVGIARLENRRFEKVNDLFAYQLGYEPEELLGALTRKIYFSDEQNAEIGQAAYAGVIDNGLFRSEFPLRKKDGSLLWGLIGLASLTPDNPMHNTLYVVQDMTDQRNLQKDLSAALARSELAQAAKHEFLNNMSHKVHTPLNGILGVLQILAMDDLTPDQKLLTEEGVTEANNLLHMLDRSLEYVALSSLDESAKNELASVGECLGLVAYQVDGLARKQAVEIVLEVPDGLSDKVFASHQTKLRQILGLLLDNAIRYNRPSGKVTLSAGLNAAGALVFSVADTGCGLDQAQIENLGQPFVRYCATESIAGAGLGLALAYRLADLLGAEINVHSVFGEGTVITVTLPL